MARPKSFEKEDVLEAAMKLFWKKGFKRTTMEELAEATGLQPGSLYSTFEDKETLFKQSLLHYRETVIKRRMKILNRDDPLTVRLRGFLDDLVEQSADTDKIPGCLLTNSSFELPGFDTKNANHVEDLMKKLEERLYREFEQAQDQQEIHQTVDSRKWARFFTAVIHGLNVIGGTSSDRKRLQDVVDGAIHALKNKNREVA